MKAKLFALFVFSFSLLGAEPKMVSFDKLQHRGWLTYITNQDTPFTGKAVSFYANGQMKEERNYKDGKYHGLRTEWYENGQMRGEVRWKNGKHDGLWTWWYENGQMRGEENWKDGKLDGLRTLWYENGQKEAEGNFKDDNYHGLWTYWYKNGQKSSEKSYKDHKLMSAEVWKPDGEKCPVTKVKDGNGLSIRYNEDGKEKHRFTFKDGERVED